MSTWFSITTRFGKILFINLCVLGLLASGSVVEAQRSSEPSVSQPGGHLQRAKIYLAAGDYRRAILACQQHLDLAPSVDAYVYLTYVYHAVDGYLTDLAQKDEWVKVGQLALSLYTRGTLDIIDPPDPMARVAREMIQEGLRQQFDLTAAMANRLDHERVNALWTELTAWKESHPDSWWAGVPPQWGW